MIRILAVLIMITAVASVGCGGQGDERETAEGRGAAADAPEGGATGTAADEDGPDSAVLRAMADSTAARLNFRHRTEHEPGRVYTHADIPDRGAYVKLNFEGLTDAQVNRTLHRFMTEPASCDGCDGLTLDEVLSNLPDCAKCLYQARALLAEMREGPGKN